MLSVMLGAYRKGLETAAWEARGGSMVVFVQTAATKDYPATLELIDDFLGEKAFNGELLMD